MAVQMVVLRAGKLVVLKESWLAVPRADRSVA